MIWYRGVVQPVQIPAGEFKAKCLALLDEVAETGAEFIVTKRGRPVAKVVAMDAPEVPDLRRSVRYRNDADLIGPVAAEWDAESADD